MALDIPCEDPGLAGDAIERVSGLAGVAAFLHEFLVPGDSVRIVGSEHRDSKLEALLDLRSLVLEDKVAASVEFALVGDIGYRDVRSGYEVDFLDSGIIPFALHVICGCRDLPRNKIVLVVGVQVRPDA